MMDFASRFSRILDKIKILDKSAVFLTIYTDFEMVKLTGCRIIGRDAAVPAPGTADINHKTLNKRRESR